MIDLRSDIGTSDPNLERFLEKILRAFAFAAGDLPRRPLSKIRDESLRRLVAMEREMLIFAEVLHPTFKMPLGRHQALPQQRWIAVQKSNGLRVLVDTVKDVVRICGCLSVIQES